MSPGPRRRRRFVVYGVGAAKSGTVTLASMFARSYRTGHEMESDRVVPLLCDMLDGSASPRRVRRELRGRDRRLRLEVDSAGFNGLIVRELVALHPDAWFVLTVRHPRDWLRSLTNHVLGRPPAPTPWLRLRDLTFGDPRWGDFGPGEEPLRQAGLHCLDGYFGHWAHRHRLVLDAVPGDRLAIVPVEHLGRGIAELADRMGLAPDSLDLDRHQNVTSVDFGVIDALDPGLVAAKVARHCADVLPRLGLCDASGSGVS